MLVFMFVIFAAADSFHFYDSRRIRGWPQLRALRFQPDFSRLYFR